MNSVFSKIVFAAFFSTATINSIGQNDWSLSTDDNEIKIYTRNSDSSDFKSVKVEAVFSGTCDKLIKIIMGVENNVNWVYHTRTSHIIKTISANEIIYYEETSLPWPMRNRDQAVRIHLYNDSINHTLKITTLGEPNDLPQTSGIVRVPYFFGLWQVKALNSSQISIEYYLNVDPGGSIPAWISNMFVAKGPYETFVNLSKLLRQ